MEELTITESKILLALKNISISPGPDKTRARLLVELSKLTCHPLWKIFETSTKPASFPNDWKEGKYQEFIKKEIRVQFLYLKVTIHSHIHT